MKIRLMAIALVLLAAATPSYAMHIMEGYLPLGWCLLWYAVSLPFLILSYRHIRGLVQRSPKARIGFALNAAFVFILSALKLPSLTGSSSHLTGTTLGTLTTGLMSMPLVGFVVLLFQALLLAHGGISTLGANIFSLAIAGPFVAYLIYSLGTQLRLPRVLSIFLAASLGSLATYVTTSLQLAVVFPDAVGGVWASFVKFMTVFAYTQVPLCVVEGLMTVAVMQLVARSSWAERPEPLRPLQAVGLSLLALGALAVPIVGMRIDFGSGADDQAGELVHQLNAGHDASPFISAFEPSEAAEPWLFVLQIVLGIALFAWAIWSLRKKTTR
ncbi:MAG: energy-coupling factor ABC transporter permease [Porphyromonas sp.]|nr:energy-coupling factor ABC transporter permease [Porphyromonas sp.]